MPDTACLNQTRVNIHPKNICTGNVLDKCIPLIQAYPYNTIEEDVYKYGQKQSNERTQIYEDNSEIYMCF